MKVLKPNEFDTMVVFESYEIASFFEVICPSRGKYVGFAQLKFKDSKQKGRERWGKFLTTDGKFLSPLKLREEFSILLQRAIGRSKSLRKLKLESSKGPAATIKIDDKISVDLVIGFEVAGWPSSAGSWGDFANQRTWPLLSQVEHLKRSINSRYHLVSKQCNKEVRDDEERKTYWRLSFSEAEKYLLHPKAECEKKYYRIVKAIFVAYERKLEPLSSYHLKTLFLHRRKEHGPTLELGEHVVCFFQDLLGRLEKQAKLPHFFVTRLDLLSDVTKEEISKVSVVLQEILLKLERNPAEFLSNLPL